MQPIFVTGIIIFTGFVFGELATKIMLPKITGYIIAGLLLIPRVLPIVSEDFVTHTEIITNIALSFITFSVGDTLLVPQLKKLGKRILNIIIFKAELAFIIVIAVFLVILPFFINNEVAHWLSFFIPLSAVLGYLASPTNPSATIAIVHEYRAKGDVTSTILAVSALDDVFGIINYSFSIVLSAVLIQHKGFHLYSSVLYPFLIIVGSIAMGVAFGFIFNIMTKFIAKETEGVFIVVIIGLLSLGFGLAHYASLNELLATMVMGIVVVSLILNENSVGTKDERNFHLVSLAAIAQIMQGSDFEMR
jgi:NhaP-type Na+/H+ or K+/H+ antiporter